MSFFEKAKAAASDLAAKADVAMTNAGVNVPGMGGDKALRDLGVIAWMDATGRPVADADRQRVMATLRDLESSGRLGPLTLTPPAPAYGTPPPPPGAAAAGAPAAPPPPPSAPASGPPPPPSTPQPPPAPPAAPPAPPEPPQGGTPPPPPPPSWA
jgi:pyruvate/2-oxoglutarate dehydrogenase complex dihydrolipoamide acyltransferase (E2) component